MYKIYFVLKQYLKNIKILLYNVQYYYIAYPLSTYVQIPSAFMNDIFKLRQVLRDC